MTLEIVICGICVGIYILVILTTNGLYKQNEELRQEIKELEIMLKDRTVHVTHKIKE